MLDENDGLDNEARCLILAALVGGLGVAATPTAAHAAKFDPNETQITLPTQYKWTNWQGLPETIGRTATLFGDIKEAGPYLVLMQWNPGYMSAPHSYRTDRLSVVLSGTWWVNSGAAFDPDAAVPVPAGGFVRRVARTPHYDGVKTGEKQPAVIALFGIGPVDMQMADPTKPLYRKLA